MKRILLLVCLLATDYVGAVEIPELTSEEFGCNQCSQKFPTRWSLRSHQGFHTRDKKGQNIIKKKPSKIAVALKKYKKAKNTLVKNDKEKILKLASVGHEEFFKANKEFRKELTDPGYLQGAELLCSLSEKVQGQ